jgi:hypothetical protein
MGRERWSIAVGLFAGCVLLWPVSLFAAPAADKAIRFQLLRDYLIVVPVFVNGTGPWNFLVDTGCSSTVIDTELDRQLNPPEIGQTTVALLTGIRHDQRVQLGEIRVGAWSVAGIAARVDSVENARDLAPGVRGILGEDFLRTFDILIDYEKHFLYFDQSAPDGEKIQFEDSSKYGEKRTINRLLVNVEFPGTGSGPVELQLDTAARMTELFPNSHVALLHLARAWQFGGRSVGSGDPDMMPVYEHTTIKVGATELRDMRVVQATDDVASDSVGLLPLAIFRRVYISHSGKFIVLNPPKRFSRGRHVEEGELSAR